MNNEKLIYANPKQDAFFESKKKIKVFIGGRGSGKSTVLGDEIYMCVLTMPRSRGFIASATAETIKNYSLPSIIERLGSLGEIYDEDFVVGKRPPSWFHRPYNPPQKYDNIITFSNGTCVDLISMYGKNAGRGGNFQWGYVDEAALIDKETHDKSLMGAMRGNQYKVARIEIDAMWAQMEQFEYGHLDQKGGRYIWVIPFSENPRYRMRGYVSSMPWASSGDWLLKMENNPDVFYIESTALDNIDVLGQEYIDDMKKTLPPIIFEVEVMNERLTKLPDGFYSEFDDNTHTTLRSFYNPQLPIEVSFDFNAGFNSMIVCQNLPNTAYIHDELYVKGNLIVDDLAQKFIQKYQAHPTKEIDIYGDRNGNNKFANSRSTIYERIESSLRSAGWKVFRPKKGLDAPHKDKHEMLNVALKESDPKLPAVRINKLNCKGLILSIMRAPITKDFKKDKSSERRLKGTDFREEATDLSDCFDNWYVFRYKHLMKGLKLGTTSAPGIGGSFGL